MDTKLAYPSFLLEVHGAEIPQGRVPTRRLVEVLDVIEHIGPCLVPRPVGFSRDTFSFQRREECREPMFQLDPVPINVSIHNERFLARSKPI
jgi:hypothetical protein